MMQILEVLHRLNFRNLWSRRSWKFTETQQTQRIAMRAFKIVAKPFSVCSTEIEKQYCHRWGPCIHGPHMPLGSCAPSCFWLLLTFPWICSCWLSECGDSGGRRAGAFGQCSGLQHHSPSCGRSYNGSNCGKFSRPHTRGLQQRACCCYHCSQNFEVILPCTEKEEQVGDDPRYEWPFRRCQSALRQVRQWALCMLQGKWFMAILHYSNYFCIDSQTSILSNYMHPCLETFVLFSQFQTLACVFGALLINVFESAAGCVSLKTYVTKSSAFQDNGQNARPQKEIIQIGLQWRFWSVYSESLTLNFDEHNSSCTWVL